MGIFEFCPQNQVRGPQIWGAKILLVPISPPILDSGSQKFLDPWRFRRHTSVLNFKTLTLKMGRGEKFKNRVFDIILCKIGEINFPINLNTNAPLPAISKNEIKFGGHSYSF